MEVVAKLVRAICWDEISNFQSVYSCTDLELVDVESTVHIGSPARIVPGDRAPHAPLHMHDLLAAFVVMTL